MTSQRMAVEKAWARFQERSATGKSACEREGSEQHAISCHGSGGHRELGCVSFWSCVWAWRKKSSLLLGTTGKRAAVGMSHFKRFMMPCLRVRGMAGGGVKAGGEIAQRFPPAVTSLSEPTTVRESQDEVL